MLRFFTILLTVIFLILPIITATADDYEPPTDQELWNWWLSISMDEKIELIRNYDIIEHTTPEIIIPGITAVITNTNDLFIFPEQDETGEDIPIYINIYNLSYAADMPGYVIEDFYIPDVSLKQTIEISVLALIVGGAIGFGAGYNAGSH